MKKSITRIMAALALLVTLAIPMGMWAADGDVHDMGITQSTLLNNGAAIPSINIDAQSYSVKKVTINWRYNKAIENPVTIEVLVGENSWGAQTITGNTTADAVFEGESTIGAIVINFTNNTGDGTGHGTFYVNSVKLTEGESSGPAPTTYTVTFDAGDGTFVGNTDFPNASNTVAAGTYTLPSATPATGYTFYGWAMGETTYQAGASYTVSGNADFVASYTENTTPTPGEPDVLNWAATGSPTNYTDWTYTAPSGAVYKGQSSGTYQSIQLRSNNNNSGIVTTTSAGKVINISVTWNSNTVSGRTLNVYGKNSAYSDATDLYSDNAGTLIGTIVYNTGASTELDIDDEYAFIGIRSNSGALYLDEVSITWGEGSGVTPPSIEASNVEIAYDATEGAIAYTINNPVDGGELTAATEAEWLTVGTVGETVPFTCSVNEDGAAREAVVTLTYTYGEQAINQAVTVTQAGNPNTLDNISDITATGAYAVQGTIVAKSQRGFIVGDGTGYVYYYNTNYDQSAYAIGDMVKLAGNVVIYGGVFEFNNSTTVTPANSSNYVAEEPTVITGEEMDARVASTTPAQLSNYVQYEGTLSVNDTHYNITNIAGATTAIGSISYPLDTEFASLNGQQVKVSGYYVGISSSTYYNTMIGTIEEVTTTDPIITVTPATVEVDAEEHDGTLDLAYENLEISDMTDFDIQYYDAEGEETETPDWIEVLVAEQDPEIGEGYVVSYYMFENEGEVRSAYFKVYAMDDETNLVYSNLVTISQAAPVVPATPGTWVLTSLADLTEDDIFVIVGTYEDLEHDSYAMSNDKGTSGAPTAVSVTIVGNTLSGEPDANIQWNISGNATDGYIFYPNGTTESWLYCTNTNNGVRVGTNNDNKLFTFVDGGIVDEVEQADYLYNNATNRYVGVYNTSDWRCYTSINSNIVNQSFAFYKKVAAATETYPLDIIGYEAGSDGGYYLIASPVTVNPANVEGMTTGEYDLYSFDQAEADEWRNYKVNAFNLEPGKGYLYAKQATTEGEVFHFDLAGTPYNGEPIRLSRSENVDFPGWNLVGNPFGQTAYIDRDFYVMNPETGGEIITGEGNEIAAMQGFFVIAANDDEELEISTTAPAEQGGKIVMNVSNGRSSVIDRAMVRFGEGRTLPKFMLNDENTKIYFTEGNEEFAVVRSINENLTPVSFHAAENGTYTLSINTENVDFSFFHLIDNMTGNDIDLLSTPSYTFEASTTDYAQRFSLLYATLDGVGENNAEAFAFFNGNEWVVNNEGEANLQVIDMTGRLISSETVNGTATVSLNQSAGIYMLRLVNGNNVKVQKVVVR